MNTVVYSEGYTARGGYAPDDAAGGTAHLEGHASFRQLTHPLFHPTTESTNRSDEPRTQFGRLLISDQQGRGELIAKPA